MSRRSGQAGYIEKKGNAFYVRFRIDVEGQEKREYRCVRICPAHGLGSMTKPERERRAKEIIAESGADSEQHFNKVEAVNLGVTFRQQARWFLDHVKTRKRKPVKPATASSWASHLAWINPVLGDVPLASVDNSALKKLVSKMAEEKFSPKTMHNYSYVVKAVVASAVNEQGNKIYPREWSHEFIDLPVVLKQNQRTPKFIGEEVAAIVLASKGELRVLYSLLAGTGLRIGEALALEVSDIVDCTITVRQGVWNGVLQSPKTPSGVREVDVHSSLAAVLKAHVDGRQSGFVFRSPSGKSLCPSNLRNRSLHAILKAMGKEACGFHSFRRFRITHLRKNRAPEDLIRFWIGHADATVTDGYSKVKEDLEFRKHCAESVGLGFELPAEAQTAEPEVAHSAPMSEVVSIAL
jgi:integrase